MPIVQSKKFPYLIVLGLVVFVIAGGLGIWLFTRNANTTTSEKPVAQLAVPSPTTVPMYLAISKPNTDTEVFNGEVLVSGKTKPGATVMIYSDVDQTIVESDIAGSFEDSVLIPDNTAAITVTAVTVNGEELSQSINIKTKNNVTSGLPVFASATAVLGKNTDIRDNNKDEINKVRDFLENKLSDKKPVKLGTDKIKGLLQKTSTASATLKKTVKIIKAQANIATTSAVLKRRAVSGVITAISGGTITLEHQTQTNKVTTVYFNSQTVITGKDLTGSGSASLKVGLRIAAVGEPADNGILAKRIHIIPGKAIGLFENRPVITTAPEPTKTARTSGTPIPTITGGATPSATPTTTITPTATNTPKPTITIIPSNTPSIVPTP